MNAISRRKFFGFGLGAATLGAAPFRMIPLAHAAPAHSPPHWPWMTMTVSLPPLQTPSLSRTMMMDAYATGSTVRLTQSYADQSGLLSTAFT